MTYIIVIVSIIGGQWHIPLQVQITNQKEGVFRTLHDCQVEIAAQGYPPRTYKCIDRKVVK